MAKIKVEYMAKCIEVIDWPDDEMHMFNYENVQANLNPENGWTDYEFDLLSVKKDGVEYEF